MAGSAAPVLSLAVMDDDNEDQDRAAGDTLPGYKKNCAAATKKLFKRVEFAASTFTEKQKRWEICGLYLRCRDSRL